MCWNGFDELTMAGLMMASERAHIWEQTWSCSLIRLCLTWALTELLECSRKEAPESLPNIPNIAYLFVKASSKRVFQIFAKYVGISLSASENSGYRPFSRRVFSLQGLDGQKPNPVTCALKKRNCLIQVIQINFID